MRAAVVDEVPGKVYIDDVDIDEPRLGEVLVRVVACGVCHSDVHTLIGGKHQFPVPMVLGHEPAGVVEAAGPGVRHVAPGDHVVACLSSYCGHCRWCASGQANRCESRDEFLRRPPAPPRLQRQNEIMHQHCGLAGFAERMLVSQHNVVKIDSALPLNRACLLGCGVLTGTGAALKTANVQPFSTVAVIGCGGVGLSIIQASRIAYASRIIAVDVDDAKLGLARKCGATDVVDARNDDPVQSVQSLTGGVDFAFEAIGLPDTAQQALAMTGRNGTMTLAGIIDLDHTLTLTGVDLVMGKTIKQSLMGSASAAADIPRLVDHALAGRLDLDVMVSTERPLDELPATLNELDRGEILGRAVITF
jgi:S-(hydroxymethyl)glutathione dehydrogenase/alcohol dehydrogenase